MKKLSNSFFFITLYILILLVPLYQNNSMNEINSLIKKIVNKNIYKFYKDKNSIEEDKKKDDKGPPPKEDNTTSIEIENCTKRIQELNINIEKTKIIIIVLSILSAILFLIIVIYSSIKCYIVCSRKNISDYRVSNLSINKLGEVYIDESVHDKDNNNFGKKINNYGAKINASNNNVKNSKKETFNPDNYSASNEDKKLYKPYKTEELQ